MLTYPYLTRSPQTLSTYDAIEMRRRAGVPEQYLQRMPAELELMTKIDGVRVMVMTAEGAKLFWKNPRTNTPMRVVAECPCCARIVPASRINQHAKVHQPSHPYKPYVLTWADEEGVKHEQRYARYANAWKAQRNRERDGFSSNVNLYRDEG